MSPSSSDSSLLLWLLAGVVAWLGAYLFLGWIRRAQGLTGWRAVAGPVLLAGPSLGLAMSAAMLLSLSAEGLPFPLGYRWLAVPVLVLTPMLACIPMAWWLCRRQNALALIGGGLLVAAVAVAVQGGWIFAAGLRPGPRWQLPLVGVAAGLALLGSIGALWLANSEASNEGARKTLWRVGAAALLALTLVAGQEVLGIAAGLASQIGSVYQREAAATWLSLAAGAVVPTGLAMMALDLTLRNRGDRHRRRRSGGVELNLQPRRKRRRKYRAL